MRMKLLVILFFLSYMPALTYLNRIQIVTATGLEPTIT